MKICFKQVCLLPVLFIVFGIFTVPAWAEQIVVVKAISTGNHTAKEMENKLLARAFETALNLETKKILGIGSVPALQEKVLSPNIDELVMSYREIGRNVSNGTMQLKMGIVVDSDQLKKILKRSGYYYTVHKPLVFALKTKGLTSDQKEEIDRLKAVSGMRSRPGAKPQLTIFKSEDSRVHARLKYADQTFSAVHREMDELWFDIWSSYFSLDSIHDDYFYTLSLNIEGWSTVEAINLFDSRLADWKKCVENKELSKVIIDKGNIRADWKVETQDIYNLRKKLNRFVKQRALDFRLVSREKK